MWHRCSHPHRLYNSGSASCKCIWQRMARWRCSLSSFQEWGSLCLHIQTLASWFLGLECLWSTNDCLSSQERRLAWWCLLGWLQVCLTLGRASSAQMRTSFLGLLSPFLARAAAATLKVGGQSCPEAWRGWRKTHSRHSLWARWIPGNVLGRKVLCPRCLSEVQAMRWSLPANPRAPYWI